MDLVAAARLGTDIGARVATGYGAQSSYPDAATIAAWDTRTSDATFIGFSDDLFGFPDQVAASWWWWVNEMS